MLNRLTRLGGIGFISVLLTVGCQSESSVGGPCEFVDFEEVVEIVSVDQALVVAKGVELSYDLKREFFESPPAIGGKFTVRSKRIVSGSCTPLAILTVDKTSD
jgi:hypothetical protein